MFPPYVRDRAAKDASERGAAAMMQPLQATQQAWLDMTRFGGASPQSYVTGLDRTFGGLFDALGFGPMRKLQAASRSSPPPASSRIRHAQDTP